MFNHDIHHGLGRRRHRDARGDMGQQLRAELRRGFRRGAGDHGPSLQDIFSHGRGGPAIRRGEIRPLIISTLRERPMHGYEVIQELEKQSGGRWRPSAGSVYPTLQQLADEGLVTSTEVDGRRTYTLTAEGQKAAAETGSRAPWAEPGDDRQPDIRRLAMELAAAVMQVHRMGSPRAQSEATRILTDSRKQMYRLLADDEDTTPEADTADPA